MRVKHVILELAFSKIAIPLTFNFNAMLMKLWLWL